MNRAEFYKKLRKRDNDLFGSRLSQKQVDGMEAILNACEKAACSQAQTAYILSTAHGETGAAMQAKRENMNYSAKRIAQIFGAHRRQGYTPQQLARKPELLANTVYGGEWGKKNLGNTQPGDGWRFRGWGIGQWTGRHNTQRVANDTGIDVMSKPEALDDPVLNGQLLVSWMMSGKATGLKLSQFVNSSSKNYLGARKVWGGADASKYATRAKKFEAALEGWKAVPSKGETKPVFVAPKPKLKPVVKPKSVPERKSLLQRIFGGK